MPGATGGTNACSTDGLPGMLEGTSNRKGMAWARLRMAESSAYGLVGLGLEDRLASEPDDGRVLPALEEVTIEDSVEFWCGLGVGTAWLPHPAVAPAVTKRTVPAARRKNVDGVTVVCTSKGQSVMQT